MKYLVLLFAVLISLRASASETPVRHSQPRAGLPAHANAATAPKALASNTAPVNRISKLAAPMAVAYPKNSPKPAVSEATTTHASEIASTKSQSFFARLGAKLSSAAHKLANLAKRALAPLALVGLILAIVGLVLLFVSPIAGIVILVVGLILLLVGLL